MNDTMATTRSKKKALPKKVKPAKRSREKAVVARRASSQDDQIGVRAGRTRIPIVGIGASAGGLDAFSQVLEGVGEDPGVAIVFVQHLAPQHESALPALLAGRTRLPVLQVTEGTKIAVDHVYVIPPNAQLEMRDGELHLNARPDDRTQYNPIDFFFRSLADTAHGGAIGVVLSGSASDGAAGLRDIKAVGGITIAQDPKTARFDAMPRAAIATDIVDLVLTPPEIAREIRRIGRHPYLTPVRRNGRGTAVEPAIGEEDLRKLFALLRGASGIDFTHYKPPTIQRRLQRRMMLQKISDVRQYLRHLQQHSEEAAKLSRDILIHVTRFFRDPGSFAALAENILPDITSSGPDVPVRIWVPGCSTGEEAYSVAIALLEHLGDRAAGMRIQVFGTDVSESAIEYARNGVYPQTIAGDVSPERLRRYFSKNDGGYRISKMVRDLCVFARQDLTRDPPFSRLDLVVCRNVLIYLGPLLQKKLLNVFHYALKATGYLMLGHAETAGPNAELFALADKKHRVYRKKPHVPSSAPAFLVDYAAKVPEVRVRGQAEARPAASLQTEAQRMILERYAPPGVIVDADLRIIQFLGHTGRFLEAAPGDANQPLPKMLREGLLHALRSAFQQARHDGVAALRRGLRVRVNGDTVDVALEVVPLGQTASHERNFVVLFHETPQAATQTPGKRTKSAKRSREAKRFPAIAKLEQELAASRDYLQSIIQELEAANEELQSANEEILSSNEELQSTNEELDTAKEELQSTNEELNTVNEELNGRNEELSRVNGDLMNLLGSVHATLVIVEHDLRIRRFTPMAERMLNLIPGDVGRPIGHIKPNIDCPNLEDLIHQVIETVTPVEREVRDSMGRSLSLQIRPYKGVDNRIDGAVLALFDVEASRRNDVDLRTAREFAARVLDVVPSAFATLGGDLKVKRVNRAFREAFGVSDTDVSGRSFHEIVEGLWDEMELRTRLEALLANGQPMRGYELERDVPARGRRRMTIDAFRVGSDASADERIAVAISGVDT